MSTIEAFRATFPDAPGYLDFASFGPLSKTVREEILADVELLGTGRPSSIDHVRARAGEAKAAVADLLGCGIAKALLGKAAVPDDLPFVTGSIGLLGTQPSSDMMLGCDTFFMIGSGFPWTEFLPKEGQARGVQIDIAPEMLSLRYPMEVPLCGEAAETLTALLPLLDQKKEGGAWRTGIEKNVASWWKEAEDRAMAKANPVNPQRVTWELSPRLPERAIISVLRVRFYQPPHPVLFPSPNALSKICFL